MLLSLNWLKDYLAKSDIKIDPKDLAEKLTMRGLQVAAIKRPANMMEEVVVGRIEKIEKHPNADRLQITQVQTSEESGAPLSRSSVERRILPKGILSPSRFPERSFRRLCHQGFDDSRSRIFRNDLLGKRARYFG